MSKELISLDNPKSPVTEAFRTLRTNIQFYNVDKELKTICITSSGPGEGKTTTICNLAITVARTGKRVLLIDGDLRKPQVHKVFNVVNSKGLTNVLAKQADLSEAVKAVDDVNGLYVLTSGPKPPNPSELLGSNRMKEFLKEAAENYDLILVDTPPVGVVTDPAVVSTMVDGTILVVRSHQTNMEEARRAKQLLENVKANILGVVLNSIPVSGRTYYRYYQYYEDRSWRKKRAVVK